MSTILTCYISRVIYMYVLFIKKKKNCKLNLQGLGHEELDVLLPTLQNLCFLRAIWNKFNTKRDPTGARLCKYSRMIPRSDTLQIAHSVLGGSYVVAHARLLCVSRCKSCICKYVTFVLSHFLAKKSPRLSDEQVSPDIYAR